MNVLISTKPFICLEAVLVGVTVRTAVSLSAAIPLGTSTKRADFLKKAKSRPVHVFLKTLFPAVCFLVAVVSYPLSTATIVVFSVWASSALKLRSWMVYAFVLSV